MTMTLPARATVYCHQCGPHVRFARETGPDGWAAHLDEHHDGHGRIEGVLDPTRGERPRTGTVPTCQAEESGPASFPDQPDGAGPDLPSDDARELAASLRGPRFPLKVEKRQWPSLAQVHAQALDDVDEPGEVLPVEEAQHRARQAIDRAKDKKL